MEQESERRNRDSSLENTFWFNEKTSQKEPPPSDFNLGLKIFFSFYQPKGRKSNLRRKNIDYLPLFETVVTSILHFSKNHDLNILFSNDVSKRLLNFAERSNMKVHFVNSEFIELCKEMKRRWDRASWDYSIGAYFKIYTLLNFSNFLYLDPDILVFSDLSGLREYKNKKVYFRYDQKLFPHLRINSGVILQRKKWLSVDDIETFLKKDPYRTYEKHDQGFLQELLMYKMREDSGLLGYLHPKFHYREKHHFKAPIMRFISRRGMACPIGIDDDGVECEINILHYNTTNNSEFEEHPYCKQFIRKWNKDI